MVSPKTKPSNKSPVKVGLFATCLADVMRPSVAFSALQLLEQAGCDVTVPSQQSCCGQPAYNSGDFDSARRILTPLFESFATCQYLVAPSASCVGMLRTHLPRLFPTDHEHHQQALRLAAKSYELTWFLVNIMGYDKVDTTLSAKVAYHSSCSSLREVVLSEAPRQLLQSMHDVELCDIAEANVCCGFGGLFCLKYASISASMVDNKCRHVSDSGAEILVSADLGCLLNIAGRLKRLQSPIRVFHIAELLAGLHADTKAIGE